MPATECKAVRDGLLGNTMDFLSKNIVANTAGPEKGIPTSAERNFDFTDAGPTSQGGRVYDMLMPNNPRVINGLLTISFLPWGEDTGYHIILEPAGRSDIMMTAALTGCSVGYMRAADGAVRVSHHNIQAGEWSEMDKLQAEALEFMNFQNMVNAPDYVYPSEGEAKLGLSRTGYVFGVRRNRKWAMYVQIVSHNQGTKYSVVSVARF
jgi:hypothetical protein